MLELLFLVFAIFFGVFILKLVFGLLGIVFHIALIPLKLVAGLVLFVLFLPLLLLLLPVVAVAAIGLGVFLIVAFVAAVAGIFSAL
jgi:hypothetical protein